MSSRCVSFNVRIPALIKQQRLFTFGEISILDLTDKNGVVADLIFSDLDRLIEIAGNKVQFVFAGKAHPKDREGKQVIKNVFAAMEQLKGKIAVAYIENYDMHSGGVLTAGVDVWLNNPQRPREASGTSGMKSAHNGVLNFSVLDGWWIEACVEADSQPALAWT